MGYMCDFCGEQRSMVYCRSDAACLCLSCDRNVHSANALSRRHSRTLVCERCNSQPAFVRCVEESLSLCQNCDWTGHSGCNSGPTHKRQSVNCYSGCPSAVELTSIWSFLLDQGMGSMSITDNSLANSEGPSRRNKVQDLSIESNSLENVKNVNNSNFWKGCLMPLSDNKLKNADQPIEATKFTISKVIYNRG